MESNVVVHHGDQMTVDQTRKRFTAFKKETNAKNLFLMNHDGSYCIYTTNIKGAHWLYRLSKFDSKHMPFEEYKKFISKFKYLDTQDIYSYRVFTKKTETHTIYVGACAEYKNIIYASDDHPGDAFVGIQKNIKKMRDKCVKENKYPPYPLLGLNVNTIWGKDERFGE